MRIDLGTSDGWLKACAAYRKVLPAELQEPLLNVQIYQGYQAALREITLSLSRLFPHKKSVAIVSHQELSFQDIAALFSGEGYQVRELTTAELSDTAAWLPTLQNDLLFVLYAIDHPVTGRVHDVEKFEAAVASARFHRIALSHAAHRWTRPKPFDVRVVSLASSRALMIAGERGKVQPQITQLVPWGVREENAHAASLVNPLVQAMKECGAEKVVGATAASATASNVQSTHEDLAQAIESFEANLPNGCHAIFAPGEARVPDRIAFTHEGIDGLALITELSALGLAANVQGGEPVLETMSACRWENPRLSEWLVRQGLTLEQQRGLVLIDARVLLAHEAGVANLHKLLASALERVLSLQNDSSASLEFPDVKTRN
jgi:hypothetical protein